MVAELARAVHGIAEHVGPGRFVGDQVGCGLGVTNVAGYLPEARRELSTRASPGSSPTLTPPPACATHAGSPRVRANSAAELLLELLPGVPVITVDSAARLIGRSEMRTGEAVNRLEAAGILRQRDVGRQRYRVFEAADVVDLFRSRTSPRPAPPVTATAAPTRRVARRMHSADDET